MGRTVVLVTGADGLLGASLARELLGRGYEVRALVQPGSTSPTLDGLDVERVPGDLLDSGNTLVDAADGCGGVFHCAAIADVFAAPELMDAVNVGGTERVLAACVKVRPGRLVFVGSASSHAFGPLAAPGDEGGGFPPAYRGNAYAESKYAAKARVEAAVRDHDLDAVVVCPTFMLGRYDSRPSSGDLIRRFVKGRLRFVSPGGRNFAHAADVAAGAVNALEGGGRGESYILGGENLTYRAFFSLVAEATGGRAPKVAPAAAVRAAGAVGGVLARVTGRRFVLDTSTARLACLGTYYSSAKAVAGLDLPRTPIRVAIEDAVAGLVEYGHLEATP